MTDRLIRRVGIALVAMGAIAATGSALHGVSNVAALVAVAAGFGFITISYDNPEEGNCPMSIYQPAFALTDALIDEAARHGFDLRTPSFFGGDGRFSVTLLTDGPVASLSLLDGIGLRLRWHYESSGRVCAVHGREFTDVTGRRWQVDVIREVGPLSTYAHLLDDEDEEAAA